MPTPLKVTRSLFIIPLVEITDSDFAAAYSQGVWWALYGDEQGNGRYDDHYLMDGVEMLASRKFPTNHVGFYLGMIHGGWLVSQQAIVTADLVHTS